MISRRVVASDVVLRRQRSGALGQHGGGFRRATRIEAGGGVHELSGDRLVRSLRPATEVEGAFVGIAQRLCEREMDRAPLVGRVHVEKRRGEERMGEPQSSRASVHHCGCTELGQPGAGETPDHGVVDAAQRRGGEACPSRCFRKRVEARAERHGERLRHAELRISGSDDLECVEGIATRQLCELRELRRGECATCPLEHQLSEVPLPEPGDLDAAD